VSRDGSITSARSSFSCGRDRATSLRVNSAQVHETNERSRCEQWQRKSCKPQHSQLITALSLARIGSFCTHVVHIGSGAPRMTCVHTIALTWYIGFVNASCPCVCPMGDGWPAWKRASLRLGEKLAPDEPMISGRAIAFGEGDSPVQLRVE